ncbi:MAG: OmpA family protein [Pseudomonadota bacterium]
MRAVAWWRGGCLAVQLVLAACAALIAPAVAEERPPTPLPAPPPAVLILDIEPGRVLATGTLPRGFEPRALHRLPGRVKRASTLKADGRGDPQRWLLALEALGAVLPRIEIGRVQLSQSTATVTGRLLAGFSVEEVRAALRSMIGPDWQVRFALDEVPPEARLRVEHGPERNRLSGILPAGISPAQALTIFAPAEDAGLTGGGGGDPGVWSRVLATLASVLRVHLRGEASVSPGLIEIEGTLAPGQRRARVLDGAQGVLGRDWQIALASTETRAAEGAERLDPVTRARERLIGGQWLPVYAFVPSAEACARESRSILARERVRFVTGSSTLDQGAGQGQSAGAVLDRLAWLARHCLDGGALRLVVGGHTDTVGSEADNRALSRARAESVREALALRGVQAGAISVAGYGAARPIADNATAQGRAQNRRIGFVWRAPRKAYAGGRLVE